MKGLFILGLTGPSGAGKSEVARLLAEKGIPLVDADALVREVLSRDDLKYCPHGRHICMTLRRSQLERQFKRA